MVGVWRFELQQLGQGCRSGLVQRGTNRRLNTLQIELARRFAVAENEVDQPLCFAGDFLPDDLRCFFPCTDNAVSATGRSLQIRVLASTNCRLSCS